jgi:voltage-gated potassium channel
MSRARLYAETFIQIVIGYSLVTYFIELEYGGTEHSRAGHPFFLWSERAVAGVFTIEYFARWMLSQRKRSYPFTFMAIIDLLAILPFYLGFLVDMRCLRLIRTLRLLRVLKVYRYSAALRNLLTSYNRVRDELYVLGGAILLLMFVSGTIVYEAERQAQPDKFVTYSDGLWWSMVTLTTVGYGDRYPITATGKLVASVTLLVGLGIFGSFISVVGGAFVSTIREERRLKQMRISENTANHIAQVLRMIGRPLNEEEANRLIDTALDILLLQQPELTREHRVLSSDTREL